MVWKVFKAWNRYNNGGWRILILMENYFIVSSTQIQGDWWVTWGLNCGEGDYPGGYDGYPCQHERFIRQDNGQWINNVTYCSGKHDKCSSDMIVTIANISLSHPGVIHHVYTDAPLSPQVVLLCLVHSAYLLMFMEMFERIEVS